MKTSLLCALAAAVLPSPLGAEPLRVPLLWPEGIYLGVQTYDGHSEIGMQGAVDFFLTHDRPDASNRDMLGRRESTPLLAPFDGDLYAFIDEREPGYEGEFAPIDPQRVSAGLDSLPVGSFSFPDGAKTHPHVHLNIFRNPGYSESNLGWGAFLDLTDPEQVLMGGQVILDRRFEISRRETWLTGLVYQYPAMPRTEFKPGLAVVVDVAWTGGNKTVPRTSSEGPGAEPLQAGSRLTVASGDPEVGDWSVWIPVTDVGGASLRVRAEHLRPEVPAMGSPCGRASCRVQPGSIAALNGCRPWACLGRNMRRPPSWHLSPVMEQVFGSAASPGTSHFPGLS